MCQNEFTQRHEQACQSLCKNIGSINKSMNLKRGLGRPGLGRRRCRWRPAGTIEDFFCSYTLCKPERRQTNRDGIYGQSVAFIRVRNRVPSPAHIHTQHTQTHTNTPIPLGHPWIAVLIRSRPVWVGWSSSDGYPWTRRTMQQ